MNETFTPGFACFCIKNIKFLDANNEILMSSKRSIMIRVDMLITDSKGFSDTIYEYMTSATAWKNKQLEKVVGLKGRITDYLSGASDIGVLQEFLGESGMCTIKLDKSKDDRYEDKFVIATYIEKDTVLALKGAGVEKKAKEVVQKPSQKPLAAQKGATGSTYDEDDGIPF
jgi:hypothetical protein